MDIDKLTAYLKSIKRTKAAIARSLRALEAFESWLDETRGLSIDDDISQEDLQAFIQSAKKGQKNLLLGLSNVFDFQGKDDLKTAAMKMRRAMLDKEVKPMRLRDFIGVDPWLIEALKAKGLRDAHQLLKACLTNEMRDSLAAELNIPYKSLLDLVKMADLSRIFAVKAVRTRLYLDSGYDTLDKLAAQDPMALHHALVKFVEESHFDGIPTTPKEAEYTVKTAMEIERWVIFIEGE